MKSRLIVIDYSIDHSQAHICPILGLKTKLIVNSLLAVSLWSHDSFYHERTNTQVKSSSGHHGFFSEVRFLCNDCFAKHHMLSPLAAASEFGLADSDIELAGEEITLN